MNSWDTVNPFQVKTNHFHAEQEGHLSASLSVTVLEAKQNPDAMKVTEICNVKTSFIVLCILCVPTGL